MFYMMSETMWTSRQYPSDSDTENELWSLQEFQEAHDRSDDAVTDETSFPSGIENVYYVDPEDVKESQNNFADRFKPGRKRRNWQRRVI